MKRIHKITPVILLAIGCMACGDVSNIGSSIIQDEVEILVDSSFVLTASSTYEGVPVLSRTTTQLLGRIEAKEYGTFSSDFVTQFMPAGAISTSFEKDNIDSLQLIMAVPNGAIVGDSIVPMGLNIYPLTKELPSTIYSDFNPDGYYDPQNVIASRVYAPNAMNETDSVASLSFRYINVALPREWGQELYQAYVDNPATYQSPKAFTSIFPGLYVANSFGSGRVVRIAATIMRLYWHTDAKTEEGKDTTYLNYGNYYAVTPEIITNNNIAYNMSENLQSMIDAGHAIISAPTGSDVELNFPAINLIETFRSTAGQVAVVNTLTMSLPAEPVANNYGINPPPYLLMVLKSKKNEFFENNDLPDGQTSFYAAYNTTTKTYDYSGLRAYMEWLLAKDNITPDDYTFVLTPITLNMATNSQGYYGSTSYLESVSPYVNEPAMVEIFAKKSKIILTYSRQNVK